MRFFWNILKSKKGTIISEKGISNRTSPVTSPKNSLYPKNKPLFYKKAKQKRLKLYFKRNVSSFPSFPGSITVEAAFVVPLFLFFCISLISIISLFQLHSSLEAALHQEVCQAAVLTYAADKIGLEYDSLPGTLLENTYLKDRVVERVGKKYLDHSMIEGGSNGIFIAYTQKEGRQDVIDIVLYYKVKPVIDLFGFSKFTMGNRCRMKAWTGYQYSETIRGNESEELVYITETGTVYHKSRNCSYLSPSVRSVEMKILSVLRNKDGGKYYSCEYCGNDAAGRIFLTDQGDRYHSGLNCPGLKRTIYVVPISEAGGRGACSKCGGME